MHLRITFESIRQMIKYYTFIRLEYNGLTDLCASVWEKQRKIILGISKQLRRLTFQYQFLIHMFNTDFLQEFETLSFPNDYKIMQTMLRKSLPKRPKER